MNGLARMRMPPSPQHMVTAKWRYVDGDVLTINDRRFQVCQVQPMGLYLLCSDIQGAQPEFCNWAHLAKHEAANEFSHHSGARAGFLSPVPEQDLGSSLARDDLAEVAWVEAVRQLSDQNVLNSKTHWSDGDRFKLSSYAREIFTRDTADLDEEITQAIAVKYFVARAFPAPRSVRHWDEVFRRHGVVGLGQKKRRDVGKPELQPEQLWIMTRNVLRYQTAEKLKYFHIVESTRVDFAKVNAQRQEEGLPPLPCPSAQTIRKEIRRLDPFQTRLAREGRAAAHNTFDPVWAKLFAGRAGEIVQMDEIELDLIGPRGARSLMDALSPETRAALGWDGEKARIQLTLAIDVRTRVILAAHISATPVQDRRWRP